MGKKFSGKRPEDQPIFTKPSNMDFEKRRLFSPLRYGSPTPSSKIGNMYYRVKNVSGDTLDAGDVVVLSITAADEVTTTTTEGDPLVFGVMAETVVDNAYGLVQVYGKTTGLKVNGEEDIAVGDLLCTSTEAKISKKAATGKMSFAMALEAYTDDDSNGVIAAMIINPRGGMDIHGNEYHEPDFISSPLTADLDFGGYKAIAMACDGGDTLPESPSDGQWYKHIKTNREILYQYSETQGEWVARAGFGSTISIYIDGTNGTDDMEHGDGVEANAVKTSEYALTKIINSAIQFSGQVDLYFGDGTYDQLVIGDYISPNTIAVLPIPGDDVVIQRVGLSNDRTTIILGCEMGDETLEEDSYSLEIEQSVSVFIQATVKRHNGTHTVVGISYSTVRIDGDGAVDGIDKTSNGIDILNNGQLVNAGTIQNCDTGIITRSGGVLTELTPTYTNNNTDKDLDPHEEYAKVTHAASHAVGEVDTIFPADPGADKVLGWDDSESELVWQDAGADSGNIDGGSSLSTYLTAQVLDGGVA